MVDHKLKIVMTFSSKLISWLLLHTLPLLTEMLYVKPILYAEPERFLIVCSCELWSQVKVVCMLNEKFTLSV